MLFLDLIFSMGMKDKSAKEWPGARKWTPTGAWVFSCPSCVIVRLWPLSLFLAPFPVSPIYWKWEGQTRPPLLHVIMYKIFEEEQVSLSLILIFSQVAEIITSSTVVFPIYRNELKCSLCKLSSKNQLISLFRIQDLVSILEVQL